MTTHRTNQFFCRVSQIHGLDARNSTIATKLSKNQLKFRGTFLHMLQLVGQRGSQATGLSSKLAIGYIIFHL